MRRDIEAASREILDGLQGDALEEMRAANAVNLRMAPLTPDHHFYIDQGANAHVRLVLLAVGRKLVEAGRLDQPDDVLFLRYNELRMLIGNAEAIDAPGARRDAPRRARRRQEGSAARLGRDGDAVAARLPVPRQLGLPGAVPPPAVRGRDARSPASPARPASIEGIARVVMTVDEFDEVRDGDILVCQMTNPAWVVLFTKIAGLVTDTGGTTSHPAVLSREFGIPAVIGTSVATKRIATGDRIRVDGTNGIVEILAAETVRRRARRRPRPRRSARDDRRPSSSRRSSSPGPPGCGSTSTGRSPSSTSLADKDFLDYRLADVADRARGHARRARHRLGPGRGRRASPTTAGG